MLMEKGNRLRVMNPLYELKAGEQPAEVTANELWARLPPVLGSADVTQERDV